MSPLASVAGARLSSSTATQQSIVRTGLCYWLDAANTISNDSDGSYFRSLATDNTSTNTSRYLGEWGNKPTLVTGPPAYWDFDGTNDYGNIFGSSEDSGLDASLNNPANFTVETWMNTDDASSYDWWIGIWGASNANKSWQMSTYAGKYTFYLWNTGGGYSRPVSTQDLDEGAWNHIVCTFTKSSPADPTKYLWNYYKNGVLDEINTGDADSYTMNNKPSSGGSRNTQYGTIYYFSRCYNGKISILRIYQHFFSADEIARNYNAECGRFGLSPV